MGGVSVGEVKRILRVCEERRCLGHGAASALLLTLIVALFPPDGPR